MLGKYETNNKYAHTYSFMEAQNIVGNIQRSNYKDLKVSTSTTYGPCVLDEQRCIRCQSHRSKFHFPREKKEP